jgi:hypothetical protein
MANISRLEEFYVDFKDGRSNDWGNRVGINVDEKDVNISD